MANKKDIPAVVRIHMIRFSSFFLTSLGSFFLENFYTAFLVQPGVLLVLEDMGEIRGFVAGSVDNRGFFKKLLRNNFFGFSRAALRLIVSKPASLIRLASNAGRSEKNTLIFAELLSIATMKNTSGYGVKLLQAFEETIKSSKSGNLPVSLTTDVENNDKAIRFYNDAGYEIYEQFESFGNRKMYRFIKRNNNLDGK